MNIAKLSKALTDMMGWTRSGFEKHSERLNGIERKYRIMQVVSNQQEFEITKNASPSQADIFNSWYRYSHAGGSLSNTFPAKLDELEAWNYDQVTDRINNTTNSTTHIGMISKGRYDKYIYDVDIWSTNQDDDSIGLVLAWHKDAGGIENTLVARRSPGGNGPLWSIGYNYSRGTGSGEKILTNGSSHVRYGNGASGALSAVDAGFVSNEATVGWKGQMVKYGGRGHIRIRAERIGDLITVDTSDWENPNYLIPAASLRVDLSKDTALAKFRGPSNYGIMASSQQDSFWQINEFSNPQDAIYRLDTKEAYRNQGGQWIVDPAIKFSDLEDDLWMFNSATGKTYFRKDNDNVFEFDSRLIR